MPDLVTLTQAKRYLGTASSSDDALLAELITQVSAAVLNWISRDLMTAPRVETRDGNGKTKLVCHDYPVTAVSSVVVGATIIPPAPNSQSPGYRFSETAIYLQGGYTFDRGEQNISIAYTAGLTTVPADMQLAALETIALAYKQREHVDVSSKSLAGETISYITADLTPAGRRAAASSCSARPVGRRGDQDREGVHGRSVDADCRDRTSLRGAHRRRGDQQHDGDLRRAQLH